MTKFSWQCVSYRCSASCVSYAGLLKKTCWTILLFSFFVVMTTNIYATVARYVRHDVDVLVTTSDVTSMKFPAIAFCNICPLRRGVDSIGIISLCNRFMLLILVILKLKSTRIDQQSCVWELFGGFWSYQCSNVCSQHRWYIVLFTFLILKTTNHLFIRPIFEIWIYREPVDKTATSWTVTVVNMWS